MKFSLSKIKNHKIFRVGGNGMGYAKREGGFSEIGELIFNDVHQTIPVRTPRFDGVVENFHDQIED